METDYLIVGQGLAGSLLGWHLWAREQEVMFVDRGEEVTSSKVAAGIVTPITGQRLAKSWRIDEFGPYAWAFYDKFGHSVGERYFFQKPVVRVFTGEEEMAIWAGKRNLPEYVDYVASEIEPGSEATKGIEAPYGGFVMTRSGYLDVGGFVRATRKFFEKERAGSVVEAEFDEESLELTGEEGARWGDIEVRKAVIFCRGFEEGVRSRFFDWVPFKSSKGEILTVKIAGLRENRIMNRGNWLLPAADGGSFRTGSTYEWDDLDTVPTKKGRRRIEKRLKPMIGKGYRYEIVGQEAAVRPIINESKALLGRHPSHPQVAFFNGLGSKGVLNGPFFANMLAGHFVEGAAIEEGVDVRRKF
jgi:glycine oxidase